MTAYALALASALLYGSGDFLGGLLTRRVPALLVVALGQFAGLAVLLLLVAFAPAAQPSRADVAWGIAAGAFGGGGVALLYRGLAVGPMSVIAPTTAVCAVAVPVLWDVARGGRPGLQAVAGIVLAVVSIVLISQAPDPAAAARPAAGARLPPGLGVALLSGVLIGGFFLTLAETSPDAGLWPLVAARVTSVSGFGAGMLAARQPWRVPPATGVLIVSGGVLDMVANALYLLATRGGPLASVVTLASLYPASTVVLARAVLGERIGRLQAAGVLAALLAVALIVGAP
ncbi:MAG: EamA family transporter [Vicinamibacterales bacterium]